jgi:hypothetical protein
MPLPARTAQPSPRGCAWRWNLAGWLVLGAACVQQVASVMPTRRCATTNLRCSRTRAYNDGVPVNRTGPPPFSLRLAAASRKTAVAGPTGNEATSGDDSRQRQHRNHRVLKALAYPGTQSRAHRMVHYRHRTDAVGGLRRRHLPDGAQQRPEPARAPLLPSGARAGCSRQKRVE